MMARAEMPVLELHTGPVFLPSIDTGPVSASEASLPSGMGDSVVHSHRWWHRYSCDRCKARRKPAMTSRARLKVVSHERRHA